jgi:CofD-related protein of GAK system
MVKIRITKTIDIPDPLSLELYRKAPGLGPQILFFSGGTALREVSHHLVHYTHNSIHLITPFDSGGSSAHLRKAFRMLAVGDVRNRLMALADHSVKGQPEIFDLFAHRFSKQGSQKELGRQLKAMVDGRHQMVLSVEEPMRRLIRNHLGFFWDHMPRSFDLRGANIGNLILAGGYLNNSRHIDPVIYLFSRLVLVRGVVRPISSEHLHLVGRLEDERVVVGQHRLTGRDGSQLSAPIKELYLSRRKRDPAPVTLELRDKVRELILKADLICYPIGSFYTSVVANLLPRGVGQAVSETEVPKVYVPNTGVDSEEWGLDLPGRVRTLLGYLRESSTGTEPVPVDRLLHHVLVDTVTRPFSNRELRQTEELGVKIIELPLCSKETAPLLDPELLASALVSLA